MGLRITVPPKGIMQVEEATTPTRRAYFLMQSMIMEDVRGEDPRIDMFIEMLDGLLGAFQQPEVLSRLRDSRQLAGQGDLYRAMMALKPVIKYEDAVLALGHAIEVEASVADGGAHLIPQEG